MYRPKELNTDLYLRKSRKDIEEEKSGIEIDTLAKHRNQLIALAKKENHNILEIHEEVVSGESIFERPKIQQLIKRMESGLVEAVLVVDIDRLGRGDMLDQGILDRAFRYSGVKLITPSDFYDPDDESWELVFGIKSLVSRQELKAITRRLQNGRRNSITEGKSISKRPPYGYVRDDKLKLYPDPETAWVVKKMFEMMRDGSGRQSIAFELDKLGISPPVKETWSPSMVGEIIKNEVYLGHLIWGKMKYKKRNGSYQRIKVPKSDWLINENSHEAIVSKELWDEANKAHSGRWIPSTEATKTLSNPLAGILKCEVCNYTLLYQPRRNRPSNAIRCVQSKCQGVQKGATMELVEERVIQGLSELVLRFNFKEDTLKKKSHSIIPLRQKAIEKKQKDLSELNTQKNNLHDFLERGVYNIETFMERQQNVVERMKDLEEEIRILEDDISKEEFQNKNINEFIPKVKKVLEAYQQTTDIEKKNRLLKSVLENATYLRKIDWKKPDEFQIQLFPRI